MRYNAYGDIVYPGSPSYSYSDPINPMSDRDYEEARTAAMDADRKQSKEKQDGQEPVRDSQK